jgi:small subunit ribosomal protein S6
MAYEIKHKPEAEYHLLQFHAPNALLERLDRTLRITDSVIRYRIIKLAPGTPDPPDLRASAVPDATEPATDEVA